MGQVNRLPSHFPNGTRYVIEGREGHILSRYLEFPDGRQVNLLAADLVQPSESRVRRRLRKAGARKSF